MTDSRHSQPVILGLTAVISVLPAVQLRASEFIIKLNSGGGIDSSPFSSRITIAPGTGDSSPFATGGCSLSVLPAAWGTVDLGYRRVQFDRERGGKDALSASFDVNLGKKPKQVFFGVSCGADLVENFKSEEFNWFALFADYVFYVPRGNDSMRYSLGAGTSFSHYPNRILTDPSDAKQRDLCHYAYGKAEIVREDLTFGGGYDLTMLLSNQDDFDYTEHSVISLVKYSPSQRWSSECAVKVGMIPYEVETVVDLPSRGANDSNGTTTKKELTADFSLDVSAGASFNASPSLRLFSFARYSRFDSREDDLDYEQAIAEAGLDYAFSLFGPSGRTDPRYPVIKGDRVTFLYSSERAKTVALSGSFNGWETLVMDPAGDSGFFSVTLELPPGSHSYVFIVDGVRTVPPYAYSYMTDDFGGENAVVTVY